MSFGNTLYSKFLLIFLLSYLINGVLSLNCYLCESLANEECDKNATSSIFLSRCEDDLDYTYDGYDSYARALISEPSMQTIIQNISKFNALRTDFVRQEDLNSKSSSIWDCAKFVGTRKGKTYILRTCTLKEISCETYQSELRKNSYEVSKCHRCDDNKCNSSNKLYNSLWYLCFALLIIYYSFNA